MSVKPFVKWVGGKRQLLRDIIPLIPEDYTQYIEPFAGGGAVFFSLSSQIQKAKIPAWLNDINPELVNTYLMVRDQPDALLADLRTHIYDKDYYTILTFFSSQPSKLFFSFLLIIAYFHAALSISEIFEDYVHNEKIKNVANKTLYFFAIIIPLLTFIVIFNLG